MAAGSRIYSGPWRGQDLGALGVHGCRGQGMWLTVSGRSPEAVYAGAESGWSSVGEGPVPQAVRATAWEGWHQRKREVGGGGRAPWSSTISGASGGGGG